MEKKIKLHLIILVLVILISSCSNDDNNPFSSNGDDDDTLLMDPATLKVNVSYSGAYTVDASHPVYVSIFDTPYLTLSVIPKKTITITTASELVVFNNIKFSPVYLNVAYDKDGEKSTMTNEPYEFYNDRPFPTIEYLKDLTPLDKIKLKAKETKTVSIDFNDAYIMISIYTFNMDGTPADYSDNTSGIYSSVKNKTLVQGFTSSFSEYLNIFFTNSSTGSWNQNNGASLIFSDGTTTNHANRDGGNCNVNVTAYNSVGNIIEGTFSGKVTNFNGTSHTITSGHFKVQRFYNLNW